MLVITASHPLLLLFDYLHLLQEKHNVLYAVRLISNIMKNSYKIDKIVMIIFHASGRTLPCSGALSYDTQKYCRPLLRPQLVIL